MGNGISSGMDYKDTKSSYVNNGGKFFTNAKNVDVKTLNDDKNKFAYHQAKTTDQVWTNIRDLQQSIIGLEEINFDMDERIQNKINGVIKLIPSFNVVNISKEEYLIYIIHIVHFLFQRRNERETEKKSTKNYILDMFTRAEKVKDREMLKRIKDRINKKDLSSIIAEKLISVFNQAQSGDAGASSRLEKAGSYLVNTSNENKQAQLAEESRVFVKKNWQSLIKLAIKVLKNIKPILFEKIESNNISFPIDLKGVDSNVYNENVKKEQEELINMLYKLYPSKDVVDKLNEPGLHEKVLDVFKIKNLFEEPLVDEKAVLFDVAESDLKMEITYRTVFGKVDQSLPICAKVVFQDGSMKNMPLYNVANKKEDYVKAMLLILVDQPKDTVKRIIAKLTGQGDAMNYEREMAFNNAIDSFQGLVEKEKKPRVYIDRISRGKIKITGVDGPFDFSISLNGKEKLSGKSEGVIDVSKLDLDLYMIDIEQGGNDVYSGRIVVGVDDKQKIRQLNNSDSESYDFISQFRNSPLLSLWNLLTYNSRPYKNL